MKLYNRTYFDRWYHDPDSRVLNSGMVAHKVALAVSAAEFLLGRRIASVLDIGCGEAPWHGPLLRLRPRLRYQGVDASPYVVKRYGRRRNIMAGRVGELSKLDVAGPFDLVVCADVLHYVSDSELRSGVTAIARLVRGLAWIEVFTASDETVGDRLEYRERRRSTYERLFRRAGLTPIGLYCFVPRAVKATLTAFERGC